MEGLLAYYSFMYRSVSGIDGQDIDIMAYAGRKVEIAFWHTADSSSQSTGCYVDDIEFPGISPVIEGISFNDCISELCTAAITVDATDPCGGNLTYTHTPLNGGAIVVSGASVVFDPPNTGPHACPYEVDVEVTSDASGLSTSENIEIYVKLAGDANGDGVVNTKDKKLVRNSFGQSGDPGWVDADVNCDGVINTKDKKVVRNQFGQTGCTCP